MWRFIKANVWYSILTVLVVLLGVGLVLIWHSDHNDRTAARQSEDLQWANIAQLEDATSYTHVAIDVAHFKVYMPELRLSLPLTDATTQLEYAPRSFTGDKVEGADVSNQPVLTVPMSKIPVRSCASLVRIAFDPKPNAFNPEEKPTAPVKLADGRTLQVYSYHLSSCSQPWSLVQANPDVMAALFQQAESY